MGEGEKAKLPVSPTGFGEASTSRPSLFRSSEPKTSLARRLSGVFTEQASEMVGDLMIYEICCRQ